MSTAGRRRCATAINSLPTWCGVVTPLGVTRFAACRRNQYVTNVVCLRYAIGHRSIRYGLPPKPPLSKGRWPGTSRAGGNKMLLLLWHQPKKLRNTRKMPPEFPADAAAKRRGILKGALFSVAPLKPVLWYFLAGTRKYSVQRAAAANPCAMWPVIVTPLGTPRFAVCRR